MTALLSEVLWLKGWNFDGQSLDYVKCFDLITGATVPRVAWWTRARCSPYQPCTGSCDEPSS